MLVTTIRWFSSLNSPSAGIVVVQGMVTFIGLLLHSTDKDTHIGCRDSRAEIKKPHVPWVGTEAQTNKLAQIDVWIRRSGLVND